MGQRLLVLDTDSTFIDEHRAALEFNFEVDFIDSSDSAIRMLESGSYSTILISADLHKKQGYAVCAGIRNNSALRDTRIVLISSKGNKNDFVRHKKLRVRADLYLYKPIAPSDLISALGSFISPKTFAVDNTLDVLMEVDIDEEWLNSLNNTESEDEAASISASSKPEEPTVPISLFYELEDAHRELKVELDAKSAELINVQQENSELHSQNVALEADFRSQGKELLDAQLQNHELQHQCATIASNNSELEIELQHKAEDLRHARQETGSLQSQNTALDANYSELKARYQSQTEELINTQQETDKLQHQNTALNSRINDLEAELQAKAEEVSSAQWEIRELHAQNTALNANINELKTEIQSQTEALSGAQCENQELRTQNIALNANINELESGLQTQKETLLITQQEKEELQNQNTALIDSNTSLEAELQTKTEQLLNAHQEMQRQFTTITTNLEELEERQKRLDELQNSLQEAQDLLKYLESPVALEKYSDRIMHKRMKESVSEKMALLQQIEALTLELATKNNEVIAILRSREDSRQHLLNVEERMHCLEREFETRVESERKLLFVRMDDLRISETAARKLARKSDEAYIAKVGELESVRAAHEEEKQRLLEDFELQKQNLISSFNAQQEEIRTTLGIMDEVRGTLVKSLTNPLDDEGN